MRSKEQAHDYRYFPEPDLIPIKLTKDYLDAVRVSLPELPDKKKIRFVTDYKLTEYDATVLIGDQALADYFEKAAGAAGAEAAKPVCNWITTELLGRLNAAKKTIEESPVSPDHLAELVHLIQKGTITGKAAKDVFAEAFATGQAPSKIVDSKGLKAVRTPPRSKNGAMKPSRKCPKPWKSTKAAKNAP